MVEELERECDVIDVRGRVWVALPLLRVRAFCALLKCAVVSYQDFRVPRRVKK